MGIVARAAGTGFPLLAVIRGEGAGHRGEEHIIGGCRLRRQRARSW